MRTSNLASHQVAGLGSPRIRRNRYVDPRRFTSSREGSVSVHGTWNMEHRHSGSRLQLSILPPNQSKGTPDPTGPVYPLHAYICGILCSSLQRVISSRPPDWSPVMVRGFSSGGSDRICRASVTGGHLKAGRGSSPLDENGRWLLALSSKLEVKPVAKLSPPCCGGASPSRACLRTMSPLRMSTLASYCDSHAPNLSSSASTPLSTPAKVPLRILTK